VLLPSGRHVNVTFLLAHVAMLTPAVAQVDRTDCFTMLWTVGDGMASSCRLGK
jgi:hypothetical protein